MCEIYNEGDVCDVWGQKTVRARKAYRCDECGGRIAPGDHHERINALHEGFWSRHRVCATCWDIWDRFAAEHRCMIIIGGLEELLDECVGDDDHSGWVGDLAGMQQRRRAAA